MPAEPDDRRQAAIALGIAVVCLVFLLETAFAHRVHPSPASPFVWGGLALVAALALARYVWLRRRARGRDDARPR